MGRGKVALDRGKLVDEEDDMGVWYVGRRCAERGFGDMPDGFRDLSLSCGLLGRGMARGEMTRSLICGHGGGFQLAISEVLQCENGTRFTYSNASKSTSTDHYDHNSGRTSSRGRAWTGAERYTWAQKNARRHILAYT